MVGTSGGLTSFMVEGVSVQRWRLYLIRFLLLFFALPAVASVFELPKGTVIRVILEGFSIALTISALSWWAERAGTKD